LKISPNLPLLPVLLSSSPSFLLCALSSRLSREGVTFLCLSTPIDQAKKKAAVTLDVVVYEAAAAIAVGRMREARG
jgi:hypothetical protein